MFNLRFSTRALKLLVKFKASKETYPSQEQMILFVDLLSIPSSFLSSLEISGYIAKESFEYFYSSKKDILSFEEFLTWVCTWTDQSKTRIINVEISEKEEKTSSFSVLAVDNGLVDKKTITYKMRSDFEKEIRKNHKNTRERVEERTGDRIGDRIGDGVEERIGDGVEERIGESPKQKTTKKEKIKISFSEDILAIEEEKKERVEEEKKERVIEEKKNSPSGILAFAKKKTEPENAFLKNRTEVLIPGRMYKNKKTIRVSLEVRNPVKMVFFKHHRQIRPPYYNVKCTSPYRSTKNTTKRILPEEEYEHNSEEEWIEGEGENIDEESLESEEEDNTDLEWVEPDANEVIFTKGQLPTLDYPKCSLHIIDENLFI